ncbi:MAG: hypothetical protein WC057_03630 [Dehalococcoidales bacterium]|jgi:hypothetical protein
MPVIYDWHEKDEKFPSEKVWVQVRGIKKNHETPSRLFVTISRQDGDQLTIRFEDLEINHFANEVRRESESATERFQTVLPKIGTKIYVPEEYLDLDEKMFPASVTTHDKVGQKMVTIIPLGAAPWYVLSPWGNGPGIVAFLQDYSGEKVFGIEVVSHPGKMRSVDAIVLSK